MTHEHAHDTTETRWDLLVVEGVEQAIGRAAQRVRRRMPYLNRADLESDARVMVATRPAMWEAIETHQLGLLVDRLSKRLWDAHKRRTRTRRKVEKLFSPQHPDDLDNVFLFVAEDAQDTAWADLEGRERADTSDYSLEAVKALLAAVLSREHDAWTIKPGGLTMACLVDVERAWEGAGLTLHQQRAIVATYGCDQTTREAADLLGVSHTTVANRARAGITKMVEFLNGADVIEVEFGSEVDRVERIAA